jgi:hypothetical protein
MSRNGLRELEGSVAVHIQNLSRRNRARGMAATRFSHPTRRADIPASTYRLLFEPAAAHRWFDK